MSSMIFGKLSGESSAAELDSTKLYNLVQHNALEWANDQNRFNRANTVKSILFSKSVAKSARTSSLISRIVTVVSRPGFLSNLEKTTLYISLASQLHDFLR